jgi:hypothetical protein
MPPLDTIRIIAQQEGRSQACLARIEKAEQNASDY